MHPFLFVRRFCLFALLLSTAAGAFGSPRILVLGDSISAAYGMEEEQGWVSLLQQRLSAEGYPHEVVNASISGETSGGGKARLGELLQKYQPTLMLLELGGNDGLRGLPLDRLQRNLTWMTATAQQAGAEVLLLGMQLPPNYGPAYTQAFAEVFVTVAGARDARLVPFLLQGLDEDGLAKMQRDGIHPGPELQPLMLDNVWQALEPMLAAGKDPAPSNQQAESEL